MLQSKLDLVLSSFYQDYPPQLERLQAEHWGPLLEWARKTFGIEIHKAESLLFSSQPDATREKLREVLSELDQWELAAVERATYTTKSLIIALALVKKHLSVEQAALAATVEVSSQIERWGEVEDIHSRLIRPVRDPPVHERLWARPRTANAVAVPHTHPITAKQIPLPLDIPLLVARHVCFALFAAYRFPTDPNPRRPTTAALIVSEFSELRHQAYIRAL
ncbi:hypothetical protein DXG03_001093 [Asterophora parasitica]|uniref:Uncharacterized protein n=1 Tax=Asterophora parasitica TaxID=117018 RepID=A0A9P7GBQ9_9AGAR|nr:hypothetical protein DXG03_001093 [Asterophora parasitica]